ncbi:unnamed protein product [Cylicocyclus nassatus]|uniref:Uncharacterized protein n=1 Tax=Cylicocyclus nassatus TaxID=53992 RepID=A0AA36DLA6_CYLNA|nr:unnamed protein product [Cylicocyclus nassatus]
MACQRGGIVGKTVATCQLEPQSAERPRHAIPGRWDQRRAGNRNFDARSEDDFWQELMELRGRVPAVTPQDAQADAQPGDTADSNEWLDVDGAGDVVRAGCAVRSALVEMDGEMARWNDDDVMGWSVYPETLYIV